MAPVNSQKAFSCRERTCKKTFTDRSNRDRHEKPFNHKPVKYNNMQPLFNEKEKCHQFAFFYFHCNFD